MVTHCCDACPFVSSSVLCGSYLAAESVDPVCTAAAAAAAAAVVMRVGSSLRALIVLVGAAVRCCGVVRAGGWLRVLGFGGFCGRFGGRGGKEGGQEIGKETGGEGS
jgi:hypothetical protein